MEFCRGLFGMPPAAPFLGRQEMEERTGQRGFPLCDSPTPGVKQYKIKRSTGNLPADGSLPARCTRAHHFVAGPLARNRSPPLSMHTPFRSHARGFRRGRAESRHAGGIPKGKALWSLLPTSGEAEVGPRRDSAKILTNSDLSDRTNFGNGFSLDNWPG